MKKIIVCLVTILCLLTFCFAGCGKDEFDGSFEETPATNMGEAFTKVIDAYADSTIEEVFDTDLLKGAEIKLDLSMENKGGEGALGIGFNKMTAELDAKLLTDLENKKVSASIDAKVETKDNKDSKNNIDAEVNAKFVDENLFTKFDLDIPALGFKKEGKTIDTFSDLYATFTKKEGISLATLIEGWNFMLIQKISDLAGDELNEITEIIENIVKNYDSLKDNVKLYSEEKDGKITKLKVEFVDFALGEDSPEINGEVVLIVKDNMITGAKVELEISSEDMSLEATLTVKTFTGSIEKPSDSDSYKESILSLLGTLMP